MKVGKNYDLYKIFFLIIFFLGAFFRFYKLNWGENYLFHPDENNIVSVINSISPPLNTSFFTKGTFAYGSLIPYVTYFFGKIVSPLLPSNLNIKDSLTTTLTLRTLSAIFSIATVYLVYFFAKNNWGKFTGLLAAGLLAFSPGLIQSAHFGTFESILIFLYLLVFFFTIKFLKSGKAYNFVISLVLIAIASSIKINSLSLTSVALISLFLSKKLPTRLKFTFILLGLSLLIVLTVLLSPYYLTPDFKRLLNYEQQLVRGEIDVFYTRQFFDTFPLLFQFTKILPFIGNPLMALIFPFLLFYYFVTFNYKKLKTYLQYKNLKIPILLLFWAVLFIPSSFLFTKWTRYALPSLPFVLLFVSILTASFKKRLRLILFIVLISTGFIWSFFFMSVYFKPDTRISSSKWIYENLENESYILSEGGNVVGIPLAVNNSFKPKSFNISHYNFYKFAENRMLLEDLVNELNSADYVVVPSRRVFGGMGQTSKKYPLVSSYYQQLFSGKLGFRLIKTFYPLPQILTFQLTDEFAEETWTVFDHPVVRVYKKVNLMEKEQYRSIISKGI